MLKRTMMIMKQIMINGLYVLKVVVVTVEVSVSNQSQDKTMLWHLRLGHMSENGLKKLSKQGVLRMDKIVTLKLCEECIIGKSSRIGFNTIVHRSEGILEYVYSDLWGPAQTISLDESKYFISLIDDYLRIVWVYMLKHKNEAFNKFKTWKTLMEKRTERKIKRLRTDNRLEYCNKRFDDYYTDNRISRHKTVRSKP